MSKPFLSLGIQALEEGAQPDEHVDGQLSGEQTLALVHYSQAISLKRIADSLETLVSNRTEHSRKIHNDAELIDGIDHVYGDRRAT